MEPLGKCFKQQNIYFCSRFFTVKIVGSVSISVYTVSLQPADFSVPEWTVCICRTLRKLLVYGSKYIKYSCVNSSGRSNEKVLQNWLCEIGRICSNLQVQCLGYSLCVGHFMWTRGTPCYLGNEFPNSIWSWNTLFTLLLGRNAEFA